MKTRSIILTVLLSSILMSGEAWPSPNSVFAPDVQARIIKGKKKISGSFRYSWKADSLKDFGLVKWDSTLAKAEKGVPVDFLPSVREAIGMLNQGRRSGDDLKVSVHAFAWHKAGFFSKAEYSIEILIRNKANEVVFGALDVVPVIPKKAESLADAESELAAREVASRLKEALNI